MPASACDACYALLPKDMRFHKLGAFGHGLVLATFSGCLYALDASCISLPKNMCFYKFSPIRYGLVGCLPVDACV